MTEMAKSKTCRPSLCQDASLSYVVFLRARAVSLALLLSLAPQQIPISGRCCLSQLWLRWCFLKLSGLVFLSALGRTADTPNATGAAGHVHLLCFHVYLCTHNTSVLGYPTQRSPFYLCSLAGALVTPRSAAWLCLWLSLAL